jgi:serine/threonine protein kinase
MSYIENEIPPTDSTVTPRLGGIDEAVVITTEVGDALDYAHRHNNIHRDNKPENSLLTTAGPW